MADTGNNDSDNKLKFDVPESELKNILSEVGLVARSINMEGIHHSSKSTNFDTTQRLCNDGDGPLNDQNFIGESSNYLAHQTDCREEDLSPVLLNSPISPPQNSNNDNIMIHGKIIDEDALRLCITPPPSYNNQNHPTTQSLHHPTLANNIITTSPPSIQRTIKKSSSALSSSSCNNNINNNAQNEWLDPFPTPDASIHSLYGSPCSTSTIILRGSPTNLRGSPIDHEDELVDVVGTEKSVQINNILNAIPKFPPIEEFSEQCSTSESPLRPSSRIIGSSAKITMRKVYSESHLPLLERLSMESIWGALNSGPDGNELLSEDDTTEAVNIAHKQAHHRRRHSEMWTGQQSNHLECRHDDSELQVTPPRCLTDKHHSIHRSLTAPMEPSCDVGLRKRSMHNPESTSCNINNTEMCRTNNNDHILGRRNTIATFDQRNEYLAPPLDDPKTLTNNNMRFHALKVKSSKAVASAKNSAGEVFSPVRTVVQQSTQRAAKLVRRTRQRLKERKELRKQRRLARSKAGSWWIVIPADHPYKIIWDILTMLWAALGAYRTHVRIRDRVFDQSPLIILTEVWFTVDILLNFITEHKTSEGDVIRDGKAVWARYLTTWFVIDILSLIPWERIYVRPIVERIKRRNFFQKTFFRSKAVVRVSRVLRGRHIKLFGKVSKRTGMSLHRMVALLIKYLPKYLLFMRNMKGALVVRALRFVHWLHNIYKKIWVKARNARQNLAVRHSVLSPNENEFDSESDDEDDLDDDGADDDDDSDNEVQPRRRLFTES